MAWGWIHFHYWLNFSCNGNKTESDHWSQIDFKCFSLIYECHIKAILVIMWLNIMCLCCLSNFFIFNYFWWEHVLLLLICLQRCVSLHGNGYVKLSFLHKCVDMQSISGTDHHNILSKPLRSEWIRGVWVMWIRQGLAGPVKKLCVWLSRAHREKNASAEEPYTLLHVNQKDEWMCVNISITQGDKCIFTPTHCMRPQAVTGCRPPVMLY